ncbi:MAG: endonuclease V [Nitrospirae bacterium]|nr:endonuclease V [Nitrospirota bacterium]
MPAWPEDIEGAKAVQLALRGRVRISPLRTRIEYVAGVDAAFHGDRVIAAACLYEFPSLVHVGDACAVAGVRFPYVPGFLSFREGPAMIEAINRLGRKPDVILFDGQGIAHPKGFGIASHVGVVLDMPTVGCAKSRLVGEYSPPGPGKGEFSYLVYRGRTVGAVLRTRENVSPVFVSPGNRIDLKGAVDLVLKCTVRYRIPEPLRCADHLAGKVKRTLCGSS